MPQTIFALTVVVFMAVGARASIADFEMPVTVTRTAFRDLQREVCGRHDACTHFVAPTLTLACKADALGWSIDASARVTALVYLVDTGHLAHEHAHLRDMRAGVGHLLDDLKRRRFASEGECVSESRRAGGDFRAALKKIAADSVAKHH